MTSASFGIDASPLATLRTRSSSTMTTALVKTFPVPSTNFPNLIALVAATAVEDVARKRSEEHTSELQSRPHLVCRLLLEKKNSSRHDSPRPGPRPRCPFAAPQHSETQAPARAPASHPRIRHRP